VATMEVPSFAWPTEAEVEQAIKLLRTAHNSVDELVLRLAHAFDHSPEPVEPPTLVAVALLRQLADDAKAYGRMIAEEAERLDGIGGLLERAEGAWAWGREIRPLGEREGS
jgi:hypothetical protein